MLFDRPVRARVASSGMPHSGPWMRGNTKNSSSASGAASSTMRAPSHRRRRSGGTAPVNWNDSWALNRATIEATIITAVPMPCA